jgi:hypothetical protein
MVGLSDSQLEIIIGMAESMSEEEKCQEFLERVAALLQARNQINDDDVAVAAQEALRALIHNSAEWQEWMRGSLPTLQSGQEFDSPLEVPASALKTWRDLLPAWFTKFPLFATGLPR